MSMTSNDLIPALQQTTTTTKNNNNNNGATPLTFSHSLKQRKLNCFLAWNI